MKALVYTDTREVTYRDEPEPLPGDGDVVVRVDAVGICGSDMHAYLGHDARRVPPLILGHEASGTVMDGPRQGQRAVLNPLISCGECEFCLGGRENLCLRRELIGMRVPGAFAEQIAIPERNLIPMPEGMDPVHAALTEPAATSVHALRLAGNALVQPITDVRALVIGGGSVGLFAALALREAGCPEIHLAETNPLRRRSAELAGVARVFDPTAQSMQEGTHELVIDAVGGRATRAMASRCVCAGGVLVHIGLMDNDGGLDVRRMTLQEITFVGTYTYTVVDLQRTLRKLHRGALGDLSWVERRPLSEGDAAFSDLLAGTTPAPKIVLDPTL